MQHSRPPLNVSRLGAIFCLVLSTVGLALSISLSVATFRATYTPCLVATGACPVDDPICTSVLVPPTSTVLGVPISVWSASIYVVTAVFAVRVLRRSTANVVAHQLLFLLSCLTLVISAVLGAYSLLVLPASCPFCTSLYVVSFLLVLGAQITRNPPGAGSLQGLRTLGRRLPDTLDLGFLAVAIFIVASGVQSMTYHGMRNVVDARAGCPEVLPIWPPTSLVLGSPTPRATISLFLDLTHRGSADEFKALASALHEGKFPAPAQLRIYHSPREGCDPTAFPDGYGKADDSARADGACLAARATECMEKLHPGKGVELVGGMFALHDDREAGLPLFNVERIERRAHELRLFAGASEADVFRACIDDDQDVLARISAHQLHAAGPEYTLPMRVIHRAAEGAPDMRGGARWAGAGVPLSTIVEYVREQAQPHAAP